MALPKVWVVPYRRGWSYDHTARAIARHLAHRFEIRLAYTEDVVGGELERWQADAVVDLWWHGTLHDRFGRRVIKQISSHRWRMLKWGRLKPSNLLQRFADDVGAIVVPSQRLLELLGGVENERTRQILLAPKGFEPSDLEDYCLRKRGDLSVGWAGAAQAPDKHVDDLIAAFPGIRLADECLTYAEMADFYNAIDVVAIASDAEGDPRPLIEGMACGCFPVSTDVGIVPELVRHGENGMIVERSPEAFRDAFAWCRANLDRVRAAGRRNAEAMLTTRTWAHVMPAWGDAIDVAIAQVGWAS